MAGKSNLTCFGGNSINYDAMRRFTRGAVILGIILVPVTPVPAQSSFQALQEELKEAKQAHQDMTAQVLANFFGQIDPAMASPDAAVALYEQAGGNPPAPSPVVTQNEVETATERQTREALDKTNAFRLGVALQLQCGLLHYAALFILKPDQPGLKDQWVTWLKAAAQGYPQLGVPGGTATPPPEHKKKHHDDPNAAAPAQPPAPPPPYAPTDVVAKALKDTLISKYLSFNAWGDKEQGAWAVKDVPRLYRATVLEPLRATPSQATLAAWDVYIAMANADEKDNDKWNQVVYPPLAFDRACDAYAVSPSTEKLEGLVAFIKANPTNTHTDDWIARVGQLMDDYAAAHGGRPATPTPPGPSASSTAPSATPGATTITEQQGDATIITTVHSNSAPTAPAPPAPPAPAPPAPQ
jgi:hypothetical protein